MSVPPLGAFWEHFEPELELFGGPKVRKSGPKSIPKTNRFLDLDFSWFWMIFGRFVRPNTFRNHWFYKGFVKFTFFYKVHHRDQKSPVFGPQKGSKSELLGSKSDPKIDKNSGSNKRGPKVEKSVPKSDFTDFEERHFGALGSLGSTTIKEKTNKYQSADYCTTPMG